MPPTGSYRAPRPASAVAGTSNTEHRRTTRSTDASCPADATLTRGRRATGRRLRRRPGGNGVRVRVLDTEPRSVAVVRLRTGLGDLLCGAPALRALRARPPRAHIALVRSPEMAAIAGRQRAYVDELIAFSGAPGTPEPPPRTAEVEPFYAAI